MPRVTTYNPKKVTLALGNHIASVLLMTALLLLSLPETVIVM